MATRGVAAARMRAGGRAPESRGASLAARAIVPPSHRKRGAASPPHLPHRGRIEFPDGREAPGDHAFLEHDGGDSLLEKITEDELRGLESRVLDHGQGVEALRRYNRALMGLVGRQGWERALEPMWAEMAFNLESFNPVFTACLLKVQCTIGCSGYEERDMCLQRLIQPLAGEYGLGAGEPLGKTHRELFADWYASVTGAPLSRVLEDESLAPSAAQLLFAQMMTDVSNGGGFDHPQEQASYALGYNLAVEHLAHPEKTWMLETFRSLAASGAFAGRQVDWKFLEVHAEGEEEHAAIGHEAVALFVSREHVGAVRQAMEDHDRDFACYYHALADIVEAA